MGLKYCDERQMPTVNITRAQEIVYIAILTRCPTMMIGETSTGKTGLAEQLAEQYDFDMEKYSLVHAKPTDMTGAMFPNQDGKSSSFLPDERIPFKKLKNSDRKFILFLDEINRGNDDTANAAMPAFDDRTIGPHELGEKVFVMGAMNPPDNDYNVQSRVNEDAALRRRVCQFGVEFDDAKFNAFMRNPKAQKQRNLPPLDIEPEWLDRVEDEPWDPTVQKFLRENMDLMHDMDAKSQGRLFPNPASWEQVNLTLKAMDRYDLWQYENLKLAVQQKIAGHVGTQVAQEFWQFRKEERESIDPHRVLENYEDQNSKIHSQIKSLIQQQDHQRISIMLDNVAYAMFNTDDGDPTDYAGSVANLLTDVKPQFGEQLMESIQEHGEHDDEEWSRELEDVMMALSEESAYNEYAQKNRVLTDKMKQKVNNTDNQL